MKTEMEIKCEELSPGGGSSSSSVSSAESFRSVDFYTDVLPSEDFVHLERLRADGGGVVTTASLAGATAEEV